MSDRHTEQQHKLRRQVEAEDTLNKHVSDFFQDDAELTAKVKLFIKTSSSSVFDSLHTWSTSAKLHQIAPFRESLLAPCCHTKME